MIKYQKGKSSGVSTFAVGQQIADLNKDMGDLTLNQIAEQLFEQFGYKRGKVELHSINFCSTEWLSKEATDADT